MKTKTAPCCCERCGNCTKAPTYRAVAAGEACCCPSCGHCVRQGTVTTYWYPVGVPNYYPPPPWHYGNSVLQANTVQSGYANSAAGQLAVNAYANSAAGQNAIDTTCRALN